jgi:glycosyltransferase involved in cell wall biosynthesis
MKSRPLVSVIVSTYNSEKFIDGKIKDLIMQTIFDQTEIIFINSGSLQNEEDIIIKYIDKYSNFKYIKTSQRESIYKAWNRGIKLASGEFVTNANTDDRLKNNAFEILSNYLLTNPDIALVYADQYVTSVPNHLFEETKSDPKAIAYRSPDYNYLYQLDRGLVFSQPMWRAKLHFEDDIWYDENYEICGDYDFQLKISQKYKMYHFPEFLGTFYLSPRKKNKSHNNLGAVIRERQKISESYIRDFIYKMDNVSLGEIISQEFTEYIKVPIPLFYIWKRFNLFLKPELVYNKYYYTIELAYYFSIITFIKMGHKNRSLKLANRFLRYSNSDRIDLERRKLLK